MKTKRSSLKTRAVLLGTILSLAALSARGGTVHTVTSNVDGEPGSLRYLISVSGRGDTINFAPSMLCNTLVQCEVAIGLDLFINGSGAAFLALCGVQG